MTGTEEGKAPAEDRRELVYDEFNYFLYLSAGGEYQHGALPADLRYETANEFMRMAL
jgi:hypothetical protein